ncbi:hypothetical protein [Segetibacter aerophilus]|nr:hypothetical protein [Segetibacter aerophilus]
MSNQSIKIFLASSSELRTDRDQFKMFLYDESIRLNKSGLILEIVQWENFLDAVSQTNLQDEYNKALKQCSIVVCLFYTKAGKYTQLEFDTALKQFHETGLPLIYTYFKTGAPEADPNNEQAKDLDNFKKRLGDIGHFYTSYNNIDDLQLRFRKQLDKLEDNGFIKLQDDVKRETREAVEKYARSINTANIDGNENVVTQGETVNQSTIYAENQQAEKIVNIGSNVGNISF